jgi:dTDP-4-amino-4,6-dideoxygalactose transaminase
LGNDMSEFLPFALPDIGDQEIEEVCDSLRSGWLTTGPKTRQFEADFATFIRARHALAVNSATSGLHLALEALGIGQGDKVVTSVNTFTASAEVICYLGADPVFVDIDENTMNMNPSQVAAAVVSHSDVKALMPVHLPADHIPRKAHRHLRRCHCFQFLCHENASHWRGGHDSHRP